MIEPADVADRAHEPDGGDPVEVPSWLREANLGGPWRSWDISRGTVGPWHVRHDRPDGSKAVTWQLADGSSGLGGHRLDDLVHFTSDDGAPWPDGGAVVVTEGEKAAAAAADAGVQAIATVCGAGGTPGADVVAFLARYQVTLSPDNDDVGRGHMSRIAQALERVGLAELRWIDPPADAAKGWDLADADAPARRALIDNARRLLDFGARPEKLSAEPAESSGRNLREAFRSAAEIVTQLAEGVEWCWRPYVAFGAITEVVGRAKAAGKTTFVMHMCRAIVGGLDFLGGATIRTPIVFLTEQPPVSLRAVLERTGLSERDDVRILQWRDTRGTTWPEIVAAAVDECRRIGARLLIVDTLPAFAGLRGDAENDAGAALAALEPLQVAAADGLAVVVVRHERKGGGDVGESARGSSAFTGAVDIVGRLARQDNPVRPTIRVLSALSRFDETPPELVIELTDEGYVSLGEEAAVAFAEARQGLLSILPDAPDHGMTVPEIIDAGGGRRSTVQDAIRVLMDTFRIERVGSGHRGDPHRFRRIAAGGPFVPEGAETRSAQSNGFLSAEPLPTGGGVSGRNATQPVPRTVGEEMASIFATPEPELPFFVNLDVLDAGPLS